MAIAHGYAKATDRMMAAAVHSNVGLMHATMAIFNAWCDRAPVLIAIMMPVAVTGTYGRSRCTQSRWAAARYGEFRLTPDGRALLVHLVGEDLKPL